MRGQRARRVFGASGTGKGPVPFSHLAAGVREWPSGDRPHGYVTIGRLDTWASLVKYVRERGSSAVGISMVASRCPGWVLGA